MHPAFTARQRRSTARCEHCLRTVPRVWLVPGDVLDSCADCYAEVMGEQPVHEQGHARDEAPTARPRATFFVRADGRRPA